ncbi:MAG: TetR/AcrR family transcriptional regulator [Bdellovibrionales bacterium]|nr:TetR/AcrR family transcriptional regulator [Bdellovibrionales bacterium]
MSQSAATSEDKKDKIYWAVLSTAIELDFKKGHLKWTLSEVSRKAKVTRSLIYYYFGRSKIGILEEACRVIGDELIGLNPERMKMWQEGKFVDSLLMARALYPKAPYLSSFIQSHIRQDNTVGENLRLLEKQFLKRIQDFFPDLSKEEVLAVYAIYWGAVFAPAATNESLGHVIAALGAQFFQKSR